MKNKRLSDQKNLGLYILVIGLAVWFLPFVVVAIDNLVGTTRPADNLIGSFGLLIITLGPAIILLGLLLITIRLLKRFRTSR